MFSINLPTSHDWGLLNLQQKLVPETEIKMFLGTKMLVCEDENRTAIIEPVV
jgi:hypothetical protein